MSDRGFKQAEAQGDAARLLLAASRERFTVAAADLLLPERSRLTDWQRLTAAALLMRLVRSAEDELRTGLAERFRDRDALYAALSSTNVAIALPVLERAQALRDGELGTVLVRRVEEHRYWKENAASAPAEDMLVELARDEDELLAADAMALLIARSRRFDRFQEPLLGQTDLPAELQHRLVWMIAAALRHYMVQHHDVPPGAADEAISAAAGEMIGAYDEGRTLEACSMRLARGLFQSGRLEGPDLARSLEEGMLPLFIAGIAVRCSLDYSAAWEVFSDPEGRGPALLLRASGIGRKEAAHIFLALNSRGRFFSGLEGDAAAAQLGLFDGTSESAAREVLRLWQVDAGYRAAIARISTRTRSAPEPA